MAIADSASDPYLEIIFLQSGLTSLEITTYVAVSVVLLCCSALISGSEIAFFSLNPHKLKRQSKGANKQLLKILEKPKQLLATILIANNFVNIAIVVIAGYLSASLFDFSRNMLFGFIAEVVILTAVILLVGEILPKVFATQKPLQFAKLMIKPMGFLMIFLSPVSYFLVSFTSVIDKKIAKKNRNISIDELSDALAITADSPDESDDKKILKGIVKFADIEVKEIMKARIDVVALEEKATFQEVRNTIINSGFSRIPIYKETFDNITGVLYIKDLLSDFDNVQVTDWHEFKRQAFFVPENKKINDLLKEFQHKKIHLAVVVDEYGGASGIITLEDVIEEIIGDINDEFDDKEPIFSKMDEDNYIFEGKTMLNDFYRIIGSEEEIFEDLKGESETLAGLILELQGSIPEKGAQLSSKNFKFTVISADNRHIKRIKVTRLAEENHEKK